MPPLRSVILSSLLFKWVSLHVLQAGTDEALSQQLQALRQTCIPEVCFLLHSVLHSSSLFKKVSRCRYIMQGLKFNCF